MDRIPSILDADFLKSAAQRQHDSLIASLGGKCVTCKSTKNLQLDHIHGRDWMPRELSQTARMRLYAKEASQRLLQVLCEDCNKTKGASQNWIYGTVQE